MVFERACEILKSSEAFRDLPASDLGHLLLTARVRSFADKDLIFRKGERAGTALFLLVTGAAQILSEQSGGADAERLPGSLLGEIGRLNPERTRTRTVVAHGPTELLEWDACEWDESLAKKLGPQIERIAFDRLATGLE